VDLRKGILEKEKDVPGNLNRLDHPIEICGTEDPGKNFAVSNS